MYYISHQLPIKFKVTNFFVENLIQQHSTFAHIIRNYRIYVLNSLMGTLDCNSPVSIQSNCRRMITSRLFGTSWETSAHIFLGENENRCTLRNILLIVEVKSVALFFLLTSTTPDAVGAGCRGPGRPLFRLAIISVIVANPKVAQSNIQCIWY